MMPIGIGKVATLVAIAALLGVADCAPACLAAADSFKGTVRDAGTGEPLEGAVIVVIWWRRPYIPRMDGGSIPYKVVEQLSGARGEFSAKTSPSPDLVDPSFVRRQVVVYKPGYRPVSNSTHDGQAPLFDSSSVGLTKIRTREEARRYHHSGDVGVWTCVPPIAGESCVDEKLVPNLVRTLAIQARIYEAYPTGLFAVEEDR